MAALQPHQAHPLTLDQFVELLARHQPVRKVQSIHVHRMGLGSRPFEGVATMAQLRALHGRVAKLNDFAFHVGVDPEGAIWLGRNWRLPPASLKGANGDLTAGPLAVALIEPDDQARAARTRKVAAEVVARLLAKHRLSPRNVRFIEAEHLAGDAARKASSRAHRAGVRKQFRALADAVADAFGKSAAAWERARDGRRRSARTPKDERGAQPVTSPFSDEASLVGQALSAFTHPPPVKEPPDGDFPAPLDQLEEIEKREAAEAAARAARSASRSTPAPATAPRPSQETTAMDTNPVNDEGDTDENTTFGFGGAASRAARGGELSPDDLAALRPHVVNLNQGRFSTDGQLTTTAADVDALFDQHLADEIGKLPAGEKSRVVFFAHGGLVKESDGLKIARKHVEWWKANNVYPIYFVWETGFAETLNQMLSRAKRRIFSPFRRDVADFTSDPALEILARALQGPRIWGAMKLSARVANDAEGGATYVAAKLKKFCDAHAGRVELHAVGHSAGSIFHSHFIPTAIDQGLNVPFTTCQFLAPAVRNDVFLKLLAPRVGKGVDRLTLFTMEKRLERDDYCGSLSGLKIYNKSLLYLIYYALEPDARTHILGLQESIMASRSLRQILGLDGGGGAAGEVVWSQTRTDSGRSASRSMTHGGFDDDAPTMNSVLRRVLNTQDADPLKAQYPSSRGVRSFSDPAVWEDQVDWPADLGPEPPEPLGGAGEFGDLGGEATGGGGGEYSPDDGAQVEGGSTFIGPFDPHPSAPAGEIVAAAAGDGHSDGHDGRGRGRRRALCVGINAYPTAPLAGCVADAARWSQALVRLGFEQPAVLLDRQASRTGILGALRRLVTTSAPGDVVVFQFSGHGTQLHDVNGDEVGGDSPGKDEAICPYDFASGAFVIDDDVAEVFRLIPDGVNLTCFIDCCHSGTMSRFAVGTPPQAGPARDERPRFITATSAMQQAHLEFRGRQSGGGSSGRRGLRAAGVRGPESMREVVFSACRSVEVAWESNGQGDFTRNATTLLAADAGMTHLEFQAAVTRAFGLTPRQHPVLDCAPSRRGAGLLRGLGGGRVALGRRGPSGNAAAQTGSLNAVPPHDPSRAVGDLLRALGNILDT